MIVNTKYIHALFVDIEGYYTELEVATLSVVKTWLVEQNKMYIAQKKRQYINGINAFALNQRWKARIRNDYYLSTHRSSRNDNRTFDPYRNEVCRMVGMQKVRIRND